MGWRCRIGLELPTGAWAPPRPGAGPSPAGHANGGAVLEGASASRSLVLGFPASSQHSGAAE